MEKEDCNIFKSYQRGLLRQLQVLKSAIQKDELEKAEILINELIEDTQRNIEE